jgi:meiotically up-regulated gene 157 (Mug157) protein
MRFAFSSHNPGWFDGQRPGLGSLHTRQPWPLGDIQAWIVGRLTGDRAASAGALERLRLAAFADGMLPEARSAGDDDARIRHWFAWPGAALAALRLLDEAGRLEERLGS